MDNVMVGLINKTLFPGKAITARDSDLIEYRIHCWSYAVNRHQRSIPSREKRMIEITEKIASP